MLVRWNPYHEMMALRHAVDQYVDPSMNPLDSTTRPLAWGMALDVVENENAYLVKANIPGIDPKDIEITFTDNVLTIKGEMKSEEEVKETRYHMRERRYGAFSRSISFGDHVNSNKITASHENGVLTLSLPKAEEAKPKRIEIKPNGKVIEAKVK